MGFIKDILQKSRERKDKLRSYQDEDRVVETIRQRKLSHDERVLIESLEEEKQKYIKEANYWEKKRRQYEERSKARSMMSFNPEFFQNDSILKEKNMFLRGGWDDFS